MEQPEIQGQGDAALKVTPPPWPIVATSPLSAVIRPPKILKRNSRSVDGGNKNTVLICRTWEVRARISCDPSRRSLYSGSRAGLQQLVQVRRAAEQGGGTAHACRDRNAGVRPEEHRLRARWRGRLHSEPDASPTRGTNSGLIIFNRQASSPPEHLRTHVGMKRGYSRHAARAQRSVLSMVPRARRLV